MKTENVYTILVAYKNRQYVDGCVRSLLSQDVSEDRIIVVDNASPYGEADYFEQKWRNIHVIRLGMNVGFSKANNEGIKLAISLGAEYCLLMNLDTVACAGMLEELVSSIPDGGNGIATPRIYATRSKKFNRFDSRESIPWYTGGNIDRETFIINQQLYDYEDTTVRDVEFASGCCMLIPEKVIQRAGFLEEDYFLYYEDVEYSLRLKKLGFTIRYNPNALLWHAEGGSQRQEKKAADYYWTRNRLLCMQTHMDMCETDPLEMIKAVIRNEDYFRGYGSRKIISYEKKAIEDFIGGITGQIASHAYYFDDSFEKEIIEDGKGAVWSTSISGSVLLCNFSDREKVLALEFGIDSEDPRDNSTYTLYLDGELYRKKCSSHMGYKFAIPFDRLEQHRLTVVKDRNRHVVRGADGIYLFFRLNSFQMHEYDFVMETGAVAVENIGATECDRIHRWNWIQAEHANITLANPFHADKKFRLYFNTYSPRDQKRFRFSINKEMFEEEVGKEFIYELPVRAQERTEICFYGLSEESDKKLLSLIDFNWKSLESYSKGIGSTLVQASPYIRGFGEPEQKDEQYWIWIVKPQGKIIIRNVEHFNKVINVSFCTFSACDQKHFTLKVNEWLQECTVGEEIAVAYPLSAGEELVLLFDNMGCPKVSEDGTDLYLSVIDFKVEELKAVDYQIGNRDEVIWKNDSDALVRYRISFNTAALDESVELQLPGREEYFTVKPGLAYFYEVMLETKESMEAVLAAEGYPDMADLLKRIDFLVAEIGAFESSADSRLAEPSNYIQGFGSQERDENSYWNWIVKPEAGIIFHNTEDTDKKIQILFNTFSACDNKEYLLLINGKEQKETVGEQFSECHKLPANGELRIWFKDLGRPLELEDSRSLYLSILNFNARILEV